MKFVRIVFCTFAAYLHEVASFSVKPHPRLGALRSHLHATTGLIHDLGIIRRPTFCLHSGSGARRRVALDASTSEGTEQVRKEATVDYENLDPDQIDFVMGYLNKHHGGLLLSFAMAFTELGETMLRKNGFSGGTYRIQKAQIVGLSKTEITLDVTVKERSQPNSRMETVSFSLDADPISGMSKRYASIPKLPPLTAAGYRNKVDALIRRLNRLCFIVDDTDATGKLIQLGFQIGGEGVGKLKESLYLNQVPHNRYVRKYFYELASKAVLDAVIQCSDERISNRMQMTMLVPELNPSMDAYRFGTLLELARSITIPLAEQNLRVRVCVQGSMGVGIFTAVPKQLNGVATLLQRMDWQSGEGEENEGMVGNYVNFGGIGKEHVVNAHVDGDGNEVAQDDVFIILCPQSMVGVDTSIIGPLREMVEAAGDRPVILVNPDLVDKVSPQGQQSVRGRQDRLDFADSFKPIFHFQCLYISGTSYFPILGALGKMGPSEPWIAYERKDYADDQGEIYIPVVSSESRPSGEVINRSFGV